MKKISLWGIGIFQLLFFSTTFACVESVTDSVSFTVTELVCVQAVTDSVSFTVTEPVCVQSVIDSVSFTVTEPSSNTGSGSTGTGTTESGTGSSSTGSTSTGSTDTSSGSTSSGSIIPPVSSSSSSGGGGGRSSRTNTQNVVLSGSGKNTPSTTITPTSENTVSGKEDSKNTLPQEVSDSQKQNLRSYAQEVLKQHEVLLQLLQKQNQETEVGISLLQKLPKELPRTGTPLTQRTKVYTNPAVEIQVPKDFFKLAGSDNTDVHYWTQVLPEQDRNNKKYIVVPSSGLIVPIGEYEKDSTIFQTMIDGREADVMPALQKGALEYPGTSANGYGEVGNKVVFGHSSYFTKDAGRYKTQFQKIIELDVGEEIWIYEKNDLGEYTRYVYVTEASYNTHPKDVEVLLSGVGKNLTLFTCTPVGGIDGRWIIKAKYKEENTQNAVQEQEVNFKDISIQKKIRYNKLIDSLSQDGLYLALEKILQAKEKTPSQKRTFEYIELQLAKRILQK